MCKHYAGSLLKAIRSITKLVITERGDLRVCTVLTVSLSFMKLFTSHGCGHNFMCVFLDFTNEALTLGLLSSFLNVLMLYMRLRFEALTLGLLSSFLNVLMLYMRLRFS